MTRWFDYRAHDSFIAPARVRPHLWRVCLGIPVAIFLYVLFSQAVISGLYRLFPLRADALYADLTDGATPVAMYILLGSFGFMTLAVALVAGGLHERSLGSVIGPLALALRDFLSVARILFVIVLVIFLLPPWGFGEELRLNMPVGQWVSLLPVSLLAVLIQTSAEEIAFRGYLQQQLAARFRSPLVWMVLPSVAFGMLHYSTDLAGANAWVLALWATCFGLLMADLTARAGTLGPAIAVHFVTNVSAILIISVPDELFGLALYVLPYSFDDVDRMRALMPVEFLMLLVMWLGARLAIRR